LGCFDKKSSHDRGRGFTSKYELEAKGTEISRLGETMMTAGTEKGGAVTPGQKSSQTPTSPSFSSVFSFSTSDSASRETHRFTQRVTLVCICFCKHNPYFNIPAKPFSNQFEEVLAQFPNSSTMAAIPSKPSTPPAQDSTWLNWLYGLVFRQAQEVQNEENIPRDPLLVSEIFSNWQVVESPEDKLNSLKAKLEKQERAQELQQFKNRRKFTRALEFFVSAITMFSKDESHLLAHKIDPNSRAAIMSRIIASFQTMWFRTLESMFFKDAEHTLALAHAWKQFEDNYAETKYSKNILGSMKDIGTFIYHGS
jgi:hypothetical protein